MTLQKGFVNELKALVAHSKIGAAINELLDSILSRVDKHIDFPLRIFASATPDALLNIAANQVEIGDNRKKSIPAFNSTITAYAATTINFQTAAITGGTVKTDGGTFALPSTTVGQFRRIAFSYDSTNNWVNTTFSAASATVGALANPGTLFTTLAGWKMGYVDLEATASTAFKTAGSATNIIENKVGSDTRIFQITGGGSFDHKLYYDLNTNSKEITGNPPFTTGLKTDTISERTATAGVTIDGVLLKDGGIIASHVNSAIYTLTQDIAGIGNGATTHTFNDIILDRQLTHSFNMWLLFVGYAVNTSNNQAQIYMVTRNSSNTAGSGTITLLSSDIAGSLVVTLVASTSPDANNTVPFVSITPLEGGGTIRIRALRLLQA